MTTQREAINWTLLVQWWESGCEDWEGFQEVVKATLQSTLAERTAELEAEVMRLREALEKSRGALAYCKGNGRDNPNLMESTCWHGLAAVDKALSTPFTPTALNDLIEEVERRTIERCANRLMNFYDSCCKRNIEDFSKAIRALPVGQIKLSELFK